MERSIDTIEPTGEIHEAASVFPMLPEDELQELAADIKANGLIHPIVLDDEGALVDGRNRLAGCRIAGVEPTYTTLPPGTDPVAYILSANVARRNLTKGQRAMAIVRVGVFLKNSLRSIEAEHGVSISRISYASTVIRHAPELADQVMAGTMPLNEAYAEARQRDDYPDVPGEYIDPETGEIRGVWPHDIPRSPCILPVMNDRTPTGQPTEGRQDTDATRQDATVGVVEAARILGVTADAVRSRLRRGTLPGHKVGDEWRVIIPPNRIPTVPQQDETGHRQDATVEGDRMRQDAGGVDLVPLVEHIARLEEQVQRLTETSTVWSIRAQQAEAQLLQLNAGNGAEETVPEPPGSPPANEAAPTGVLAWWRRLTGT